MIEPVVLDEDVEQQVEQVIETTVVDEDLEFDLEKLDIEALFDDATDEGATAIVASSDNPLGLDDTDLDMYIQSSSYNHHARQPIQNYGHGVNGLRQSGYLPHHPQVSLQFFFLLKSFISNLLVGMTSISIF